MSESKLDVYAEIKPIRSGWRWQIKGDVPEEWRTYRDKHDTRWTGPGGYTGRLRTARRLSRRALKQIRRFQGQEPEVIR